MVHGGGMVVGWCPYLFNFGDFFHYFWRNFFPFFFNSFLDAVAPRLIFGKILDVDPAIDVINFADKSGHHFFYCLSFNPGLPGNCPDSQFINSGDAGMLVSQKVEEQISLNNIFLDDVVVRPELCIYVSLFGHIFWAWPGGGMPPGLHN